MNLKQYLLLRIVLAIAICLTATAAYVLYRTDRQLKQEMAAIAESVDKQLEVQLFRIDTGFGNPAAFPDLALWKQNHNAAGVCIRFVPVNDGHSQSACKGMAQTKQPWPNEFEKIYRLIFNPDSETTRSVSYNRRLYGSVSVISSADLQLARAWDKMAALSSLSGITGLAVCLLIYRILNRALRPARIIVAGLNKMQAGDLTLRLPDFEVEEWRDTSTAINALAARQHALLGERQELALRLMTTQEQERRYLARELHDELGQCLAAINAIAASIAQTAELHCPSLVAEAENISGINRRIMETLRMLLLRLRPVEIDEFGLKTSLNSLIAEWKARSGGKVDYRLTITGDCRTLPEPLPVTVYRIVQEGLTNIAKHSAATTATVTVNIAPASLALAIEDNGLIDTSSSLMGSSGLGLAGIRERVMALGGQLDLEAGQSGGFAVRVTLPIAPASGLRDGQ